MITRTLMERCFPTRGLSPAKYNLVRMRDQLILALNEFLPKYKINTYARVRAFLSCCGVETDYFKTTAEYASGADYEHRRDLGNIIQGDGRAFKGSGLIQTTGRFNFVRVVVRFVKKLTGKDLSSKLANTDFKKYLASPEYAALLAEADRLGCNFLAHPELMRNDVRVAVEAACIFWEENNLNAYADAGKIKELNGLVNRGDAHKTALGWDKRSALYDKLGTLLPKDLSFNDVGATNVALQNPPAPAPTPAPPATDDDSDTSTPDTSTDPKPLDLEKAQPAIDKCSATLQNPAVKTIARRAGGRLLVGLGTIWSTTGGKIALILTGVVIVSVLVGVCYSYRKQIVLGYEIAKATVKKAIGSIF